MPPGKKVSVPRAKSLKKPLTERQRLFVKYFSQGMGQTAAAEKAGFAAPKQDGHRLVRDPKIQLAVAKEREKYAKASGITKKKIIDGMLEAVEMAKTKADPTAMIQGYREIGRMCGFYEPAKTQIEVSVNGQVMLQKMQELSDEELLKLAEESGDLDAIEGEFEEVLEATKTEDFDDEP